MWTSRFVLALMLTQGMCLLADGTKVYVNVIAKNITPPPVLPMICRIDELLDGEVGTVVNSASSSKAKYSDSKITFPSITMDYRFEERQPVRVTIYEVGKSDQPLVQFESVLAEIATGEGGTIQLEKKKLKLKNSDGSDTAVSINLVDVSQDVDLMKIQISGEFLFAPNSKLRTMVIVLRKEDKQSGEKEGKYTKLYHSEFSPKSIPDPVWNKMAIPGKLLADNPSRLLCFRVLGIDATGKSTMIGEYENTYTKIMEAAKKAGRCSLINKGPLSTPTSAILIRETGTSKGKTFLQYISESNTVIDFMVGVDWTGSNLVRDDPDSLHNRALNQYKGTIKGCGNVLEVYDDDNNYAVFAFGGTLATDDTNKVLHVFHLNGTPLDGGDPSVSGVDGILTTYDNAFDIYNLCGPTHFAPLINRAAERIKADKNPNAYYILLIMTDGNINDMADTKRAIIAAAKLPLSIVIVGIHNPKPKYDFQKVNWALMVELDGDEIPLTVDGIVTPKDIVQFVCTAPYFSPEAIRKTYKGNADRATKKFASALLAEAPGNLMDYKNSQVAAH